MSVPRIEHVITGLDTGGAELMLKKLLMAASGRYTHSVTSLTSMGDIGTALRENGFEVRALSMGKGAKSIPAILRLARVWRSKKPDLIQTWMYHSDIVGGVAAKLAGIPVVWNIRQTTVGAGINKRGTRALVRLSARLSKRVPGRIICCSQSALESHRAQGYCNAKMLMIPNGFELNALRAKSAARRELRRELGVEEDVLLVGRVGRYHPQKDYATFLRAARHTVRRIANARFVLVGEGLDWDNKELVDLMKLHEVAERCELLGRRADVWSILQGLDVSVSSSSCGEGFPNVVAESMACAVPAVVTDVGDSAIILDDHERVASPGDAEHIAAICAGLLDMSPDARQRLGERDRASLGSRYSLAKIVDRYETLYSEILSNVRHNRIY